MCYILYVVDWKKNVESIQYTKISHIKDKRNYIRFIKGIYKILKSSCKAKCVLQEHNLDHKVSEFILTGIDVI